MSTGQKPLQTQVEEIDFKSLFDVLPQRYIIMRVDDPVFTFVEVNQGHLELTGMKRDQIVGRGFFEVFPDVSEEFQRTGVSQITRSLRRVIKSKQPDVLEDFRYDIPDGAGSFAEKYWRPVHYPILNAAGKVEYILQASKDITDQVLKSRELARTEARLNEALSIGKVGSWVWDLKTDTVTATRDLAEWFGITNEGESVNLPLKVFTDSIHPEDQPRILKSIKHTLKTGKPYEEEYRTLLPTGEVRWIIARGKVEHDETGKPSSFPGVIVDVTERKEAESLYTRQLDLTHTIVNSLAEGVYALDADGRVTYSNRAAEKILGYANEDLHGKHIHDYIHHSKPDGTAIPRDKCTMLDAMRTGRSKSTTSEYFIRKDGTFIPVSVTTVPMKRGREIVGAVQSFADITESRQTELNLRFLADATVILNKSLDYNKTMRDLAKLGVPSIADWCAIDMLEGESVQQVALAHRDPRKVQWAKKIRQKRPVDLNSPGGVPEVLRTGKPLFYPVITEELIRMSTTDPEELEDLLSINFQSVIVLPIKNQQKTVGAITLVSSDSGRHFTQTDFAMAKEIGLRASVAVTNAQLYQTTQRELHERERLERELREVNEELEARVAKRTHLLQATNASLERSNQELQDFAYVASHDLQEPLRKIQAFSNLLANEYASQLGDGQDYLERMKNAASRMSTLIEDLLSFSRVTTKARPFESVDLQTVTYEVVGDLEARLGESGGSVTYKNLPTVLADPTQMRQLLQNLIGNALKFARPDVPPEVVIKAKTTKLKDGTIGTCVLTVSDNGIGFDEKYRDRIFAVFQRLHGREQYQGTGIGLAICRKIAERHGGNITATSKPGTGSTFTVTLKPHTVKQESIDE